MLQDSGVFFTQFTDPPSSRKSTTTTNRTTTTSSSSSSRGTTRGNTTTGRARRAGAGSSSRRSVIDLDGWKLSGEDISDIADLLGIGNLEDLLEDIGFEDEEDVVSPRSKGARHRSDGPGYTGGGGGIREEEEVWVWGESDEESSNDDDDGGDDGGDWTREARRFYGPVG